MDEKQVLQTFDRKKILTIDQLVDLLQCSAITVRRRLKQWSAFTSINKNGRYYTLPRIPVFDGNGLWRYQTDAEAVLILVEFIKHPGIDMTRLSKKVKRQSKQLVPAVIEHFLQSHDLLKKLRIPGDEVLDTI